MPTQPERRLYEAGELIEVLRLGPEKIDWLVRTGQLTPLTICGELRFDSFELNALIATYRQVAQRKQSYVQ